MTLINMGMLGGLALLAAPVLIYFLINRKKIVLHWAAYEWMKKAVVKRRKRNKLDDVLKLLAKVLLMLALVLLAARPAVTSQTGSNMLLVIDNTLSMGALRGGRTRLDAARTTAESFLRENALSAITVCTYDGALKQEGKTSPGIPLPSSVLKNIELSTSCASGMGLIPALAQFRDIKNYDTICFLSDFQASDYTDRRELLKLTASLKGKKFICMPVDTRPDVPNISIDSCDPPKEGFFPGRPNRLAIRLTNHSKLEKADIPVTLLLNGKKHDRANAVMAPGSSAELFLTAKLPAGIESELTIQIPPDSFEFDNSLAIAVNPPASVKILSVVNDVAGQACRPDIFLRNALEAAAGGDGSFFQFDRTVYRGARAGNADEYDMIMCFGVPFVNKTPFAESVDEFVRNGNVLLSFADETSPKNWAFFGLEGPEKASDGPFTPDRKRLAGTLLEFMDDGKLEPEMIHFRKVFGIPAGGRKDVLPLLCLEGMADPAALEIRHGAGRIAAMGFLPVPAYTDLVYNPNFIQFTMRLLARMSSHTSFRMLTGERNMRIPMNGDLEEGSSKAVYTLEDSKGQKRYLSVGPEKKNAYFVLDDPFRINGICTVRRNGDHVFRIGLNLSRNDSNLEAAERSVFDACAENGLVFRAGDGTPSVPVRREFLWLTILLLLTALAFDHYVHFWRKF